MPGGARRSCRCRGPRRPCPSAPAPAGPRRDAPPVESTGGRIVHPAARPGTRACRCGAPRPTTTASAAAPSVAGRRPRSPRAPGGRVERDGDATVRRAYVHRRRHRIRPRARLHARAGGAIHVEETVVIPAGLDDVPARRHRPRVPARSRDRSSGTGPARTRPTRIAVGADWSAAGHDRRGRRTVLRPPAGERRPRRRPLADPRRPARADGLRLDARSAAPGVRHAPRARTSRRPPTTSTSSAAAGDDRPPRRRPPGSRDGELRPGHARAVSRRTRHVPLVVDAAGHPVTIECPPRRAPVPPPRRASAWSCGSTRTASSATSTSGPRSPLGRSYRHLGPDPFPGFDGRVGDPVPMAYPTSGIGDFRVPALVVRGADGTTTPRAALPRPPDHARQAGAARPALDLRRGRRRGRDARGRPSSTSLVGLEVDAPLHDLPRPPGDRPQRDDPQRRHSDPRGPDRDEPRRSTCPTPTGTMVGLAGAWARERHVAERRLRPGPPVGRRAPAARRAPSTTRSWRCAAPTTDEAHGEAYGVSLVYSGNFLAEAEVEPFGTTRVRIGIAPETFAWRAGAGRGVHDARGGRRLVATTASAACRTRSTGSTASGWRAAPGATGRGRSSSTTGRRRTSTSTHDRLVAIATVGPRPRRRAVRPRRRLVRPARRRHDARSATGSSTGASCPTGIDGIARADHRPRPRLRALDRARDGQPATATCSAPIRTGSIGIDGRQRTESRQQLVLDLGRPEVVDHLADALRRSSASAPISYVKWDMNRYLTEVGSGACRPTGRARPSTATSSACTSCTAGSRPRSRTSCSSRARAAARRFDPGMLAFAPQALDQRRHRRRSSACGSSGGPRWSTRSARWRPTSRRCPTTRSAASPPRDPGRGRVLRRASATSSTRPPSTTPSGPRSPTRSRSIPRHRDVFQRGRFLRLESPFGATASTVSGWSSAPDGADGRSSASTRSSTGRHPRPSGCACAAWMPTRSTGSRAGRSRTTISVVRPQRRASARAPSSMAAGLRIDLERHEAATLGDFWARLFVLSGST